MMKSAQISTFLLFCTVLSACGPTKHLPQKEPQFWQRISSSSAIWQRGPKAQQLLHRDIARCVTETKELERIGALRNAIPLDPADRVLDPDAQALARYQTPERDGDLLAEYTAYQDFDGCMMAKGWERTAHVPYAVRELAHENHIRAHNEYRYQDRYRKQPKADTHDGNWNDD